MPFKDLMRGEADAGLIVDPESFFLNWLVNFY